MCGRYALRSSVPGLARLLGLEPAAVDAVLGGRSRFNIAPTQWVPVCRVGSSGEAQLVAMHWGLVPPWLAEDARPYRMINARAETAASKPAFRGALRTRRCLVPAHGYYEWQATHAGKQPWFVHHPEGEPLAFAGLWEGRGEGPEAMLSFAIVTRPAAGACAEIHHRMPLLLDATQRAAWLDGTAGVPADFDRLATAPPSVTLAAHPVSRLVNNPRNDDARCLEAVPLVDDRPATGPAGGVKDPRTPPGH